MITLLQQTKTTTATDGASWRHVEAFIRTHWDETMRHTPADDGTLLGLPFPYTVPCRDSTFQEMYYWDTYFASIGLLHSGRSDLACFNARNFFAQITRHGFVPNGNRTYYTNRSQPPYLAALVQALDATSSLVQPPRWTNDTITALRAEYVFWTTRRSTGCGLSRYGHNANDAGLRQFHPIVATRLAITQSPREAITELSHALAEAESGWDFTPRFDHRCEDFCPVDLNSLLCLYELYFRDHDESKHQEFWAGRLASRLQLINDLMWDEARGGFFDYDHRHAMRSRHVTAAAFHPLWAGIATPGQAARVVENLLPCLEFPHGLATCAPPDVSPGHSQHKLRQWDFPNGWPCLQLIAWRGLARYGYTQEAIRLARKYLDTVTRGFVETGDLWEKYNVEDGSISRLNENGYLAETGDPAPAMMGWTAGAFLDALNLLREIENNSII